MENSEVLEVLFCKALTTIDAGDLSALGRPLASLSRLVRDLLDFSHAWLRGKVGSALEGFNSESCHLLCVAVAPESNGKLPVNIAAVDLCDYPGGAVRV